MVTQSYFRKNKRVEVCNHDLMNMFLLSQKLLLSQAENFFHQKSA